MYPNMMEIQYFRNKIMKTTTKNYGGGRTERIKLNTKPNLAMPNQNTITISWLQR